MNLHQRIIQEITDNPFLLEASLEMYDCNIHTEISLGEFGDIDVKAIGFSYKKSELQTAIIEVKAHEGLVLHYKKLQLPKYVERFPSARQLVVFSKTGKPYFKDLVFHEI